jgi:hypothetical protein
MTRKDAKAAGLDRYVTGKPCHKGHLAERRTSNGRCTACEVGQSTRWTQENRDRSREQRQQYRASNKDKVAEWNRNYVDANRDKIYAYQAEWRLKRKQQ